LVLTAALCYAASGNGVKVLFQRGYAPATLAQLRIGFAFVWLLLILLVVRRQLLRVPRNELLPLAVFGVVAIAGVQLAYYLAIAKLNIAIALCVQYLGLVGITAWERYRRQQHVAARVWVALALVLIGSFFMVGAYRPALLRVNLPGIGLALLAAGLLAFFLLRASTLVQRIDRWTVLLYAFGAGTAMWIVYDLALQPALPGSLSVWGAMAVIGLLGTLLPFGLEVAALQILRPSVVGIVATAEPVFAGLIAFFVLRDLLELPQVLGAAVVLTGIVVVQLGADQPDVVAAPVSPD
jgi:drug/metabolite transporter (DMT)-like permease